MRVVRAFVIVVAIIQICEVFSASLKEELTLTQSEKLRLDKFRSKVEDRLPHEYMKGDLYLVRWLRATKFNLEAAEEMLLQNLEWRKENNMDDILNEDFSDFQGEYRYSIEGCDKEGRPVVSVFLGDWDLRKIVLSGQSERLRRYIDYLIEEVNVLIRKTQEKEILLTQFSLVIDLNNYNLVQHGCPLCIPIELYFVETMQQHFTGTLHKLTVINIPQVFEPVLQIIKSMLSEKAQKVVSFYGRERQEWQAALLKESDKEKLTIAYGGSKEYPYEMEHFKDIGYVDCSLEN